MTIKMPRFRKPETAYNFARKNCGRMTPEQLDFCRQACLGDPGWAYMYALEVDRSPREDTRQACLGDHERAYMYALNVDKSPRDDTRQACLGSPNYAYWYARDVDGSPREDTRQTCLGSPEGAYEYARDVDQSYHELTYEAVKSTEYQKQYEDLFEDRFFVEKTHRIVMRNREGEQEVLICCTAHWTQEIHPYYFMELGFQPVSMVVTEEPCQFCKKPE